MKNARNPLWPPKQTCCNRPDIKNITCMPQTLHRWCSEIPHARRPTWPPARRNGSFERVKRVKSHIPRSQACRLWALWYTVELKQPKKVAYKGLHTCIIHCVQTFVAVECRTSIRLRCRLDFPHLQVGWNLSMLAMNPHMQGKRAAMHLISLKHWESEIFHCV